MAWKYRCDSCGCYLDPGEGLLCEECRQKIREWTRKGRQLDVLLDLDEPQIRLKLEEMVHVCK